MTAAATVEHDTPAGRPTTQEWRAWWEHNTTKDSSTRRAAYCAPLPLSVLAAIVTACGLIPVGVAALAVVLVSLSVILFLVNQAGAVRRQPHVILSECGSWWWVTARPGVIEAAMKLPVELAEEVLWHVSQYKPFAVKTLPWTVRSLESMRRDDEAFVTSLAWLTEHDYPHVCALLTGSSPQVYERVIATASRHARAFEVAAAS